MTAVVALRKIIEGKPCVVIAADSLFTRGQSKVWSKDASKLIKFPHFVAGFSGLCSVQSVLYSFSQTKTFLRRPFMKMETPEHALEFAREAYRELRYRLDDLDLWKDIWESVGDLVIATETKIFLVDKYAFPTEADQFTSTGCVDDLIAGVVLSQYHKVNSREDLKELANACIEAACEHSIGCGPPVNLVSVEEKNLMEPPEGRGVGRPKGSKNKRK
jgi:20S proteasome alpha/beta subunit